MAVSALARLFAKLVKRFGKGEAQSMMRKLGYSELSLAKMEKVLPKAGIRHRTGWGKGGTFAKRKAARVAKPTTEAARAAYEARQKAAVLRRSNLEVGPYGPSPSEKLPRLGGGAAGGMTKALERFRPPAVASRGPRLPFGGEARAMDPRMAEMMGARTPSRGIPPTRGDNYRKEFEKKALEGMRGYSPLTEPGQLAKPKDRANLMMILKALGLIGATGIASKVTMDQLGSGDFPGVGSDEMI
jgi:hypothetical protein